MISGPPAASYELRIGGHLDGHWSTWFGGFTIIHEDDGTTTLRGVVTDQSELHGLLAKVRDLGVSLISVTPAETAHDADSQQQQQTFGADPTSLPPTAAPAPPIPNRGASSPSSHRPHQPPRPNSH